MTVLDLLIHFRYGNEDTQSARQYYLPGDELHGVVTLNLGGAVRATGLSIRFLGQASVAWENPKKNKTYVATESYIDTDKPLLDIGYDNTVTIPSGVHQFRFQYFLPTDLPSSFNGTYGNITYLARARLDCEDDRMTTVTSEPFMVLRRPELPLDVYEPKSIAKSKLYIGWKSGKIKVKVTIDKAAAIPGDYLIIDADVSNLTGKLISLIQAAVVMESRYYAEEKEVVFRQYINTRDDHFDTKNRRGRRWHKVKLQIPPFLADSGLETCNIMGLRYFFQFKVVVKDQEDICVEIPLYVGLHAKSLGPGGKDLLLRHMWHSLAYGEDDMDGGQGQFDHPWYGSDPDLLSNFRGDYEHGSYGGSMLRA